MRPILLALIATLISGLASASTVLEMKLDGTIHQGTTTVIETGLAQAKEMKAEAFLIEMDTPGGMLDATRDIVKLFLNTDIPVIVYVAPSGSHAGSAGTFITMAAHVAAMAPGTNIGAAHPVSATGADPEKSGGKRLEEKIRNDTSAFIETIAKQRGRNTEWARKAVLESAAIDETKALEIKVIDLIAKNKEELLKTIDGRTVKLATTEKKLQTKDAQIVPLDLNSYTKIKNWLANPTVMFVLLLIAGLGIYMEMSHPGLIMPAVTAGLAIVLLLVATSVLPLSVIGLGLIVLGFGLLIAEVYVTSFGLLAAGGILAFIIGAYLLFDPTESDLRVPRGLIYGTATGIGTIAVLIGIAVGRIMKQKQTTGSEGLIGVTGTVDQRIEPGKAGKIYVLGEFWNATADEPLDPGTPVTVEKVEGLQVFVKKV